MKRMYWNTVFVLLSLCYFCFEAQSQGTRVRGNTRSAAAQQNNSFKQQLPENEIIVYSDSMHIMLKNPPLIQVTETVTTINDSEKPGLQIPIYSGDLLIIGKNWKKYLKSILRKRTKFLSSPSGDYYFTDDAYIPRLSANTIDLYAEMEPFEDGEGLFLNVFFDLGGAFLSEYSHPEMFIEAATMLEDFAVSESVKASETRLLLEEERLFLLKAERDELRRKEAEIQFQIDKLNDELEKAKGSFDANREDIDQKNQETKEQISTVEQVKLNLRSFATRVHQ